MFVISRRVDAARRQLVQFPTHRLSALHHDLAIVLGPALAIPDQPFLPLDTPAAVFAEHRSDALAVSRIGQWLAEQIRFAAIRAISGRRRRLFPVVARADG